MLRNFAAQDHCEIVWACDLSEKNIEKTRKHYPALRFTQNVDDIFADTEVQLVLIATPTSTHFPLAKKALESGKHVFIEKPIAGSFKEADEIVRMGRERNLLTFVDHTFVFAPAVQRLGELASSGKLGDLLYFESSRINLGLIQKDTNVLWDLAIHDLSILGSIMDLNDVKTVAAHGSKHFGPQIEQAHMHLTFASGFTAHIHVSWLSPVKIRQTVLAGTKAMALYDDTEPSEKLRVYDRGIEHDDTKPDPFFPKYRAGDILIPALSNEETLNIEAAHILNCVQGKEKPLVTGEDGAKIVKLLELANESLNSHSALLIV